MLHSVVLISNCTREHIPLLISTRLLLVMNGWEQSLNPDLEPAENSTSEMLLQAIAHLIAIVACIVEKVTKTIVFQ